ncbi:MAG: hypothetical protein QOH21_3305 [Acidobacteriota bacterium]|jgi:CHAT domain-containing protein/tetratricopeptide (TPR) repeat protein|nr:hypothetical protein [Acidobacteriota bacterium]
MTPIPLLLLLSLAGLTGETVRAGLPAGGRNSHTFSLHAGEVVRIEVDQHDLDVAVRVTQPDRHLSYKVDNLYETLQPEELVLVAAGEETWTVEIAPHGQTTHGAYTVRVMERGTATPGDHLRAETDAAYWRLAELLNEKYRDAQKQGTAPADELRGLVAAYRTLGDVRREAEALLLLPTALDATGQSGQALPVLDEALGKAREACLQRLVPHILSAMGDYAWHTDQQRGLTAFTEALVTAREQGSKQVAAHVLNHFGTINREVDPSAAIDYYMQALALWSAAGDRRRVAYAYHNVAGAQESLGDRGKAIRSLELALAAFHDLGDGFFEANTLASLGMFLNRAGRYGEALARYREGLALAKANHYQSPTIVNLIGLAHYHVGRGAWNDAKGALDEAEPIAKVVGGLDLIADERAIIDFHTGRTDRALPVFRRSVDAAEARWTNLRGGSLRTKVFGSERHRYDILADALIRLGRETEAFDVAEKSRARAFLSLLSEARTDIRAGAPQELVDRDDALERELAAAVAAVPPGSVAPAAQAARTNVQRLSSALEEVEGEMRRANPRYASLAAPNVVTLADVRKLLDPETLLLYYNLSYNREVTRSFLWAVTTDTFRTFSLPGREPVKKAVQAVLAQFALPGDRNLTRLRLAPHSGTDPRAAAALSTMILGDVRELLQKHRRVVVVPDGALHSVPFVALPFPGTSRPLVSTHEIVVLPSASVLAFLREGSRARSAASRTLAVFADPVFSSTDDRLRRPTEARLEASMSRAARDVGLLRAGGEIPRLVYTLREANAIAGLVPAAERRILTGLAANREEAFRPDMADFRILHFATHGIIDSTHPPLSGLLLSRFKESGQPIDGYLRANDILRMHLNADLVVLSGCRTGLGKEIRSEGFIGLTEAFFHAGAQRVVMTLWNIDDQAAAEVMGEFYRGMLQDHLAPAEALRRAQDHVRRQPRWADPYYWAAFTYVGDWR